MEALRITGGARLSGSVRVTGAKNSALKLMAATLLAPGRSVLHEVPDILDVRIMAELLRRLGCVVEHDPARGTVAIEVPDQPSHQADYDLVRRMRASICVIGPLATRVGAADVALPGGDNIGSRGLDMHVTSLERMGAQVSSDHGFLRVSAPQRLHGAQILLEFPSVGATETALMAAVLAEGVTVIDNAAREPEIVDICTMLQQMGAQIDGIGSSTLEITGVDALRPVTHTTVPDRIVAGTWAIGAVMTQGDVHIDNGVAAHLTLVLDKLERAGASVDVLDGGFRVRMDRQPHAVDVVTLPYPGFPTDLQPQMIALNAVSDGAAMVTENLFEARFRFVHELTRLEADVRTDGHHALVRGCVQLSGAPVEATDIRAGAGLVLAGLVAEGITTITGVHHIDRGYAAIVDDLHRLGVQVERVTLDE